MIISEEEFRYRYNRKGKLCHIISNAINIYIAVLAAIVFILVSSNQPYGGNTLFLLFLFGELILVSFSINRISKKQCALEYRVGDYYFPNGKFYITLIFFLLLFLIYNGIFFIINLFGIADLSYNLLWFLFIVFVDVCLILFVGTIRFGMTIKQDDILLTINWRNKISTKKIVLSDE